MTSYYTLIEEKNRLNLKSRIDYTPPPRQRRDQPSVSVRPRDLVSEKPFSEQKEMFQVMRNRKHKQIWRRLTLERKI